MIYITGDIHGGLDIRKLSSRRFKDQHRMSKDDYLIICGDFGLVWDDSKEEKYWKKWLSDKPFTTLWIDGNHENFDKLKEIPNKDMFGGAVKQIAPDIYYLNRSQVLTIDNNKFFVMGGASSHDKAHRTEHKSWWADELPSNEEMESAIESLDKHNWEVNFVVTHCAPKTIQRKIASWYENDSVTGFLERVRLDLKFEKWFFGHYHIDQYFQPKFYALYDNVIPITNDR